MGVAIDAILIFGGYGYAKAMPVVYATLVIMEVAVGIMYSGNSDAISTDFAAMLLQQEVVDHFVKEGAYDKLICAGSYLDVVHKKDPYTGFLRGNKPFSQVSDNVLDLNADYVVMGSLAKYDKGTHEHVKRDSTLKQVWREVGKHWAEVYERTYR